MKQLRNHQKRLSVPLLVFTGEARFFAFVNGLSDVETRGLGAAVRKGKHPS